MSAQHDQRPSPVTMGTTATASFPCAHEHAYLATTLAAMVAAIEKVEASEPIGQWMRWYGFSPEHWFLFLPNRMRAGVHPIPPPYVRFSSLVDRPMFVSRQAVALGAI